ncbi:MAG: S41 family peptidase, partial [Planctomycetales bacterium]|nr:S41 family peptidase [Planctomycetales bacterium]
QLRDLNVWIEMPSGERIPSFRSSYAPNYDHDYVRDQLVDLETYPPLGFAGRTRDGLGFIACPSLPPENDDLYDRFFDKIATLLDCPGMIVDLRGNRGGAEPRGAQIAGVLTQRRVIYARSQRRSGPRPDDLSESPPRYLAPHPSLYYPGPVVCLIGPGCVSSGEGFALMMAAVERATLVGQPTRGASGNPSPVALSNGVKVWFSRWISLTPDGVPIESRGVTPDVETSQGDRGDAGFERARELLTRDRRIGD